MVGQVEQWWNSGGTVVGQKWDSSGAVVRHAWGDTHYNLF